MPIYTYRCSKCGDEFDIMQSMSDEPRKRCSKCRGALKRVYHPVGIVLKGSGFYKTDYRSSKKKTSDERKSEAKSDAAPESKSSDGGKSDSKKTSASASD